MSETAKGLLLTNSIPKRETTLERRNNFTVIIWMKNLLISLMYCTMSTSTSTPYYLFITCAIFLKVQKEEIIDKVEKVGKLQNFDAFPRFSRVLKQK